MMVKGAGYTKEQEAFVDQLVGQCVKPGGGGWKEVTEKYISKFPDPIRTSGALRTQYSRQHGRTHSKRTRNGTKTLERFTSWLERSWKQQEALREENARLQAVNVKLRTTNKSLDKELRETTAENERLRALAAQFQAPLVGKRGQRTQKAMVSHSTE